MTSLTKLLGICAINVLVLGGTHVAPALAERVKLCANEGQECWLKKRAVVRYGQPGDTYTEKTATGRIPCTNEFFGDPTPRRQKVCWIVEE